MTRRFERLSLAPLLLWIGACQSSGGGASATLGTDAGTSSAGASTDTSTTGGTTTGTQGTDASMTNGATTSASTPTEGTTSESTTTGDATSGDTTSGDTSTGSTTTGDTSTGSTTSGDTTGSTTTGSTTTGDTTTGSTTGDMSTTDSTDTGGTSTGDTGDTTGGMSECVQHFDFMETETCYTDAIPQAAVAGTSPLLAGDVDQDGHVDIIVPGAVDGILVFRGDGAGGLLPPLLTPYDPATAAAVGDLDADGRLDLVVGVPGGSPRIDLLLGDGMGAFVVEDSFLTEIKAAAIATGDFDADGDLDVVAIHNGFKLIVPKRLSTLTSAGGQSWSYGEQPLTLFVPDQAYDAWVPYLTTGTFDGVHLDVVVSTVRAVDAPHRLRSDGQGAFTDEGLLDPNFGLLGVMPLAIVDVDDDGDNDVIGAGKPGSVTMKSLRNLGGGAWTAPLTSDLTEFARQQIAVGELIQGPRPDIVYTGNNGLTMARRIEVDGKVVSPGGFGFQLGHARAFVLADLNEDGMSDFVFITAIDPSTLAVRLSK